MDKIKYRYKIGDTKKVSIGDYHKNIYIHFTSSVDRDRVFNLNVEEYNTLFELHPEIKKAIDEKRYLIQNRENTRIISSLQIEKNNSDISSLQIGKNNSE